MSWRSLTLTSLLPHRLRRPSGRQWWYSFGILTALPAAVLTLLALRAVRAGEAEARQRLADEHAGALRVVESILSDSLPALVQTGPVGVHAYRMTADDVVVFPAQRLYFGESLAQLPDIRPRISPAVLDIVEAARGGSENPSKLLQQIALREPMLRSWAQFAQSEYQRDREGLRSVAWSTSEGVTPTGLPMAILAAESAGGLPLLKATLDHLRAGRWWLSYAERSFHDAELSRMLGDEGVRAGEDAVLRELSSAAEAIQRSSAKLRAGQREVFVRSNDSGVLIVASMTDHTQGHALTTQRLRPLLDAPLRQGLGRWAQQAALREASTGATLWNGVAGDAPARYRFSVGSVPGLELIFTGALSETWGSRQQALWYSFIVLLTVMIVLGLAMTAQVVQREMELARRQADFLAAVTHEFKSPLTSLRLLLHRLSVTQGSADTAGKYRSAMERETERLDRLVTRLLESQKIDAGKRVYVFEQVPLAEFVRAAVERFTAQAAARRIRLVTVLCDEALVAAVDCGSASEAVDNLIDNAIRYSPQDTSVEIRLRRDGSDALIEVCDSGIGIDPEDLPHVFERFYRGRRGDRYNVHGSGLGLALVKAAAEAHGGAVQVASTPGKGSAFQIRLPLERTA